MLRRIGLFFYLLWLRVPTPNRGAMAGFVILLALPMTWSVGYLIGHEDYNELAREVKRVSNRLGMLWPDQGLDQGPDQSPLARLLVLEEYMALNEKMLSNIKESLYQKEREAEDLAEEVYFYRQVLAPEDKESKLEIFSMRIGRAIGEREYPISLIIRRTAEDNTVKGQTSLFIRGMQNGGEKTLDASSIFKNNGRISFKYFQRLEGSLHLPDGYEPRVLLVRVTSDKHGKSEKTYHWNDLLNENEDKI